ncbi:type II toxin-antitoxin system RelE/ParE family toxin [Magnetofaba australis]|uniref:Putative toxin, RelE family n=1 Tax=Magnetofaba australis IT-1 TaxID=1434232 RepID=A0A1Y2KA10_9PROT|nr:type II toxin-antitoxin system RelE/ParE family toxin [Magnetofaba australis]OSM07351.1 putative toxin, RelE family [Magnetofaba australis IT-1]
MRILQSRPFKNAVKRLHANQKKALDVAVRAIVKDPDIGEPKVGDLSGVRVYKFKMVGQLMLLAYEHDDESVTLFLLALGSHENFYRDLKQSRD